MEKYVNEGTIVKSSEFESFKNLLFCPLCHRLMLEPLMCSTCQNHYCKICIENSKKKNGNCPNDCENSIFIKVIEKNRAVTKFKYRCIKGCGAEISYNDIQSHYNSNCLLNKYKSKLKILTSEQVAQYRSEGKSVDYMTSKLYYLLLIIL